MYRKIFTKLRSIFCDEVLVIGDSHVEVFRHQKIQSKYLNKYFNVCSVGGATVSGLINPNSKTQALPIFKDAISNSKAKTIIVNLGEVDTGFVIWYRAEKNKVDIDFTLEQAVDNYISFLDYLVSTKNNVICISAPLPTITDNQEWGDVANLRRSVKTTQKDRTELTLKFNEKIAYYCESKKIAYLSLDSLSLGIDGTVKSKLLNPDPTDHHYNQDVYAEMLIDSITNYL
ncbi:hypothetical protein JCM19231_8 [Vibrio ishigakensis]|uniref:SGNH hydrolase-type esterase domain-containing protein n=1 Tax=Vibrio ishigakensis TaxID=1481914 RepID=A0A0B8P6B5_9VIBR|nr:SGNH/GDSL hydrolase family protein [Vibrio ishigakensis]GAM58793.1 hypothetical protein JCM19231_8 [Vibrio ishigakensis]